MVAVLLATDDDDDVRSSVAKCEGPLCNNDDGYSSLGRASLVL